MLLTTPRSSPYVSLLQLQWPNHAGLKDGQIPLPPRSLNVPDGRDKNPVIKIADGAKAH